jgi:hypothetical protein
MTHHTTAIGTAAAPSTDGVQGQTAVALVGVAFAPLVPVVALALLAGALIARRYRAARRPAEPAADGYECRFEGEWHPADCEVPSGMAPTLFCPICGAEYVPGTATCEDCAVDLVEEEELPAADPPIEQGTVRLMRARSWIDAHMIRQFLASNRIPCSTLRSSAWDVLGTEIHVFESDALRARRLLNRHLGTGAAQ